MRLPLLQLITSLLVFLAVTKGALAFDTQARAAYVLDLTTDTVLLEKDADKPLPPASMSKLMTLNMLFEALDDGRVSLDTRFGVSDRAKAMGGSTMFLTTRDRPTVDELIQGIVVQSGNDATVVVAEGLGGSEEAFARMMTERAKELGMTNSTFANASGWPHPLQRMSVRDLGRLTAHMIEDLSAYYPYFAQQEFDYDGRAPANRFNRNPLLGLGIGADGLKTGHTQEAGYGLVGSAVQDGRRIVFVITGLSSELARAEEAERIVNWAFRQFSMRQVVAAGKTYATADVWMGELPRVKLVAAHDQSVLIPALVREGASAKVNFSNPVEAPIEAGQELGELIISVPELPDTRVPLVAKESVERGGFVPRLRTAAQVLLRDHIGNPLDLIN